MSAKKVEKKPVTWSNILLGAALQTTEVCTLGQPFEVMKTHMAANRKDNIVTTLKKTYGRGGLKGFYQGLWPWAIIEASTKGGVLLFASSEIDYQSQLLGASPGWAGLFGGMGGGVAQAYTTMGFCTFMKTVEVTRKKSPGTVPKSTFAVAYDVYKREGIIGMNKGVSAVAVRQMTNWGSRFGIARLTEQLFRGNDKDRKLKVWERLSASVVGGALACWNHPIEVVRVEMQSQISAPDRPKKLNIWSCGKYIYKKNGFLGLYRGVTPRIGLSVYVTILMVFCGDTIKAYFQDKKTKH